MASARVLQNQEGMGESPKLEAEPGIWAFVFGDLSFFLIFFFSFLSERSKQVEVFRESQQTLNQTLGMANTLILLASSWFVVLAIQAIRADRQRACSIYLGVTIACGLLFLINKAFEYHEKLSHGVSMLSNDFYMFYYVMTGIHMMHVVGGVGLLTVILLGTRSGKYHRNNYIFMELGGIYWHMVDLLWVLIFPLVYLLV